MIALTGAGALAANPAAFAQPAMSNQFSCAAQSAGAALPDGFRWGTATSAYQIEGAWRADGKGESIWDRFVHRRGKIRHGDTGDVAIDHYHRYRGDVELMKALGAQTYRFSIGWPRIFPQGTGKPDAKGLDFYDRLTDELLANNVAPFATLYHWDLPQALQDRGGWESRDTAAAFADYSGYVAQKLGDRIRHFFTLNEISAFIDLGYGTGRYAPGLKLPPRPLNQARHNALLAHGLAVAAIRAKAPAGTEIGLADNMPAAIPALGTPSDIAAAERAARALGAGTLTAVLEGRYTDDFLRAAGAAAPKFSAEDMRIISAPLDFIGITVYTPLYVRAIDTHPGYEVLPFAQDHPRMASSWQHVGPEALYWAPRHLQKIWNVKNIYIAENGCGTADVAGAHGVVNDTERIMFLRNNLTMLQRATAEGVPVRGYFLWSLFDNFEWVDGYATRFGIIRVDLKTQKRTPKLSAAYYAEVIRRNAVA